MWLVLKYSRKLVRGSKKLMTYQAFFLSWRVFFPLIFRLKSWLHKHSPQNVEVYKLHNFVSMVREIFYFRDGIFYSSPLFIMATDNIPPYLLPCCIMTSLPPSSLYVECTVPVSSPLPPCVPLPCGFCVFQCGLASLGSWDKFPTTNSLSYTH